MLDTWPARYLAWSDGAQIRLLKLHVCHKLGQRMTWVENRLAQLMGLLPDLMQRIEHMKADMLVNLVDDCEVSNICTQGWQSDSPTAS